MARKRITVIKYAIHAGAFGKATLETALAVFAKLEARDGCVTAKALLQAARPKTASLHDEFEWDDSIAGEQFRLAQAGRILRHIDVVLRTTTSSTGRAPPTYVEVTTRALPYVGATTLTPDGAFVNVQRMLKTPTLRTAWLDQAKAELASFRTKYSVLSELNAVMEAIEKVLT